MREMFVLGIQEIILFRWERVGRWVFLDIVIVLRECGLFRRLWIVLWVIYMGFQDKLIIMNFLYLAVLGRFGRYCWIVQQSRYRVLLIGVLICKEMRMYTSCIIYIMIPCYFWLIFIQNHLLEDGKIILQI
jgi:hypothetical protein